MHTDEETWTDNAKPVGITAVPREDPNWDYETGRPGQAGWNHMAACLIVSFQTAGRKAFNFDKLQLTKGLDENSAQFLARLTKALQIYTRLDSTSTEGTIALKTHFISQSSPDIQKKLKKAEEGPQTPQRDL